MYLREHAEIAAWAVSRSRFLDESDELLPNAALQSYWSNSRHRILDWKRRLEQAKLPGEGVLADEALVRWRRAEGVLEEVFHAEILTRVWTAMLLLSDDRRDVSHAGPIGRSVFVSHLEIRRDALAFMLGQVEGASHSLTRIDMVRRRCERWTDFLLSQLDGQDLVQEFCFDPIRVAEFRGERTATSSIGSEAIWRLMLAGVRRAFAVSESRIAADEPTCQAIFDAVLEAFPESARNGTRLPIAPPAPRGLDQGTQARFDWNAPLPKLSERQPSLNRVGARITIAELRRRSRAAE